MKFGLWFFPVVAIGTVGTLLAASLPVPPSLPSIWAGVEPARPTAPPAATPMQAAAASPAAPAPRAIVRPREVTAALTAPGTGPNHLARKPIHRLAKATPDRHPRTVARAVEPRYGAIVAGPPGPYPGMPVREPTQIAMAPPPYGMPAPYWRAPYRSY
jgi:hypothetical protein